MALEVGIPRDSSYTNFFKIYCYVKKSRIPHRCIPAMTLYSLSKWSVFHIDALGLVTMLGADDVNFSVGSLSFNMFSEYMPLLGSHVFASNQFTTSIPGFILYNVTEGIMTHELSGWFSRWLLMQKMAHSRTQITMKINSKHSRRQLRIRVASLTFSVLIGGMLLTFAIFDHDWYGLSNTLAMISLVTTRQILIRSNLHAVHRAMNDFKGPNPELKMLCVQQDGKAITIKAPKVILRSCLLKSPAPKNEWIYSAARIIAWASFGVHIMSIGSANLFHQLFTVTLVLTATILTVRRVGTNERIIGKSVEIERYDDKDMNPDDRRQVAYARLCLSQEEQETMLQWNLFPSKRNSSWWKEYKLTMDLYANVNVPRNNDQTRQDGTEHDAESQ